MALKKDTVEPEVLDFTEKIASEPEVALEQIQVHKQNFYLLMKVFYGGARGGGV